MYRLITLLLLACLSYNAVQAGYIHAKAMLAQYLIAQTWQQTTVTQNSARPWPWADTYPVAAITLPRLGVHQYILAGTEGESLAFGPAWMRGTALPGAGNSVIAGHRDTHFAFLQHAKVGDKILIERKDQAVLKYRINSFEIVDSRTQQLTHNDAEQQLTLVTCYPFNALNQGPLRLKVTATLIEAKRAAPATDIFI